MKADDYDLAGALEAMAAFGLGNGDESASKEAEAACRELLAALTKLDGRYGFNVGKGRSQSARAHDYTVAISAGNGRWIITVAYRPGSDSCFVYGATEFLRRDRNEEIVWKPLPITFDPNAGRFVGKELDAATVRRDQLRPRVDAVTVIVEAVIKELRDLMSR